MAHWTRSIFGGHSQQRLHEGTESSMGPRRRLLKHRDVYIFSVTRIGDLVSAASVFQYLSTLGDMVLVVAPEAAPLVQTDPRFRRVVTVRSSIWWGWRLEVLCILLRALAARALVINLEIYLPRARFIRRTCRRLGLEAWHLNTEAVQEAVRAAAEQRGSVASHFAAYYTQAVGLDAAGGKTVVLAVSETARQRVVERLQRSGCPRGRLLIVMHAGGSPHWPAKRPPASLYASVLREFRTDEVLFILIGTDAERALCDEIIAASGEGISALNWAGEVALDEIPALLERTAVFVGNDSGPLKIAEAVGTKTVSLWGPTSPELVGPRGDGHRIVRHRVPCHPCYLLHCSQPVHCLGQIDPAVVVAEMRGLLRSARVVEPR
jgi:ADP-heptose:LPS heptosyltransferase